MSLFVTHSDLEHEMSRQLLTSYLVSPKPVPGHQLLNIHTHSTALHIPRGSLFLCPLLTKTNSRACVIHIALVCASITFNDARVQTHKQGTQYLFASAG